MQSASQIGPRRVFYPDWMAGSKILRKPFTSQKKAKRYQKVGLVAHHYGALLSNKHPMSVEFVHLLMMMKDEFNLHWVFIRFETSVSVCKGQPFAAICLQNSRFLDPSVCTLR